MRVQTRGEFGGLGIEVTQEEGFVKVVSPIDGTPAAEAGIEAGDFITHVDGESVLGLTLDDAVDLMRGPVGSEIVITVVREDQPEPFDVTIVRDTITLQAVRTRTRGRHRRAAGHHLQRPDHARSSRQGSPSRSRPQAASTRSTASCSICATIPAGLLTQAIKVSDAFLDKGEIVSTRGREPADGERYNAEPRAIWPRASRSWC